MKRLADGLTASRALIAIAMVLLGFEGKKALPAVVWLTILGWTTDILDGRFARRAPEKKSTWLGDHDFQFDMLMVFAILAYLALAGFVSMRLALIYTAIAAVAIAYFRSKSVTELFMFLILTAQMAITYRETPQMAYLYLLWIVVALLFNWRRFTDVVREFIENMKRLHHSA